MTSDLISAVKAGNYEPLSWKRVRMGRVELAVATDALKVHGIRYGVSARAAQQIADLLGCVTPTAMMAHAIYNQADVHLQPHPQNVTSPDAEHLHNAAIDRELAGRTGLVADVGKYWVLAKSVFTARPMAANYGWHYPVQYPGLTPAPGNGKTAFQPAWVIQPNPINGSSMAHNMEHWDYSQTLRLVQDVCLLDGRPTKVKDILTDFTLAWQLSAEGPLLGYRLPVAELEPLQFVKIFPEERHLGDDPSVTEYIQARGYTEVQGRDIRWIVLHSMESQNAVPQPGTAQAVAKWFGGPSAPQASAHYCVDPENTIQGVREKDVAWAAPGANAKGIQIEMAGKALKTEWAKEGGLERKQLLRVATLVKGIAKRWNIPMEVVTADALLRGERGITTHATVSEAYRLARQGYKTSYDVEIYKGVLKGASNHGDPGGVDGKLWPMGLLLQLIL